MDSFQIRQKFLDFFAKNNHTVVASSSLIPAEDPTLLFTNAGMNQFKDLFLGKDKRTYTRATSSQKCVRAGGKHNDLEQVGFTERHLTFFEMLGNFSFGDYFKKEAIPMAWEFLTTVMQIPADKLHVTIYKTDDDAFEVWNKIVGLPESKITRLGEKDNFWQMGNTGPCGPCTEIYIDRGVEKGCNQPGCAPGCDCARFMEIWNNVFMQYDRQADGSLQPLKQTGVDTGMGLERLCVVMQNANTVFDIDLFATIIKKIEILTKINYANSNENTKAAFRVLADHVRSCSLLIADGCSPANDGRGYVLRKIIRRAALFAQKLSDDQHFFSTLAQEFISFMSPVFPELEINKKIILFVLDSEIERFTSNLVKGQVIFEKYRDTNKSANSTILSGEQVFKLYDTYGFPPELTMVLAREHNFTIDMDGFEAEMKKQQEQSGEKQASNQESINVPEDMSTSFVGYDKLNCDSTIQYIQEDPHNKTAWIVSKESPFYVESGGQISDTGSVTIKNQTFPVCALQKMGRLGSPAIAMKVDTTTKNIDFQIGDTIHCAVNAEQRASTTKNHTAAHLLQAALIKTLGAQVKQAGSQVSATTFRFDFTHHQAMTAEQIEHVEILVNQKIQENIPSNIFTTTLEKAKEAGACAFFGEKYDPKSVRVVQIPGFSAELCGGTHVQSTGTIGCFKIISEVALATGTRRIVGVTGPEAVRLFQETHATIKKLSEEFKAKSEDVLQAVKKMHQANQEIQTELKALKKQLLKANSSSLIKEMTVVNNIPFLFLELENTENDDLKTLCQELEKITPGFYFIVSKGQASGTNSFLGYVCKNLQGTVNAKQCFDAIKNNNPTVRGGGSPAMIQGSGQLDSSIKTVITEWLQR